MDYKTPEEMYSPIQLALFKAHSHMQQDGEKNLQIAYPEVTLLKELRGCQRTLNEQISKLNGHSAVVMFDQVRIRAQVHLLDEMIEFLSHSVKT